MFEILHSLLLVVALAAGAILLLRFGVQALRRVRRLRRRPLPTRVVPGRLAQQELRVGRLRRSYLLFVPPAYQRARPAPLVLVFHGGGGAARAIAGVSQMHRLAMREGFIVAYPEGTGRGLAAGFSWNAGGKPGSGWAERRGIDDVRFVRELVAALSQEYSVDPRRIYALGMSQGGMLAYRLACQMSEVFAAVAAVAATMTTADCRPKHPVSVLHIHGSADQNVPLQGGRGRFSARGADWPPVARGLDHWRKVNGCAGEPVTTFADGPVTCVRYRGAADHCDVEYCLVEGGGHAWPGGKQTWGQRLRGDYVAQSFHATEKAWQFFKDHPKAGDGSAR